MTAGFRVQEQRMEIAAVSFSAECYIPQVPYLGKNSRVGRDKSGPAVRLGGEGCDESLEEILT
jgi:hypothetical protein